MSNADDSTPHIASDSNNLRDICRQVRDQGAAYALGVLEPSESDWIEEHLLICHECDRELSALLSMTSLLGVSVPQSDPPIKIRARLMAAIQREVPVAVSVAPGIPGSRTPLRAPSIWASSRLAVVPLVLALLLLGTWTASTHQNLNQQSDEVARLRRENEALTAHLSSIQAGQQALGSSGIWYPLSNIGAGELGAGGIVLSGPASTSTLLSVWNMPDGYVTYHVVCESKRGEMLAAGDLNVNENGTGSVTLELPAPVSEFRAVHVVPSQLDYSGGASFSNDILQLLLGEPTAIAAAES